MPDPKKNKNAPPRAATDTGTGNKAVNQRMKKMVKAAAAEGAQEAAATARRKATPIARPVARPTTQTNGGAGVHRRGEGDYRGYGGAANVSVYTGDPQDNAANLYAYDYDYDSHDARVNGTEGKFYSLRASGGHGGRVGDSTTRQSTPRPPASDPFLKGFNSDDVSVSPRRNRGGNRRKSR